MVLDQVSGKGGQVAFMPFYIFALPWRLCVHDGLSWWKGETD